MAVAGAMERKVYMDIGRGPFYPTMYVIFCGPPGVGKTEVTSRVEELWAGLQTHHIAPKSVSKASLVDELKDAERTVISAQGESATYNSLQIVSNELGVLIPAYDNEFMNALTDLYDGKPYAERKRGRDLQFDIPRPQINLLAATTPSYLNNVLPEGAWDQGFLSRTFIVYSGDNTLTPLWDDSKKTSIAWKALQNDLGKIASIQGEFRPDVSAKTAIQHWHMSQRDHEPSHPKLRFYNSRRTLHMLKLCMICAAARTQTNVIELEDFQRATDLMIELEKYLPDVFKSMSSGGDSKAIQELWHFTFQLYIRERKPIAPPRIIAFLQERVPAHSIDKIIDVMVRSGIFQVEPVPKLGDCYVPKDYRN